MNGIKALAFDVGGSVFDWKSAVASAVDAVASLNGIGISSEDFAMKWRLEMFKTLGQVHAGEITHCNMDDLLAISLDTVLSIFSDLVVSNNDKTLLLKSWHAMEVWDEFPEALRRMKSKYKVTILSVLSFSMLVDSSKHADITWDAIISCEFLSCYKQKPEAYQEGAALLGLRTEEICFVAVHPSDLLSAKKTGMKTAYVAPKASEPDVPGLVMPYNPEDYDFNANTYLELCDKLGC